MKNNGLLTTTATILLLCSAAASAATYTAIDITGLSPAALNESGQIIGNVSGFSGTIGMGNAAGQMAKSLPASGGATHAFITDLDGAPVTDLGTLGGTSSYGNDINDHGSVVGRAAIAGNTALHAFVTGANGIDMIDLDPFGESSQSEAFGINASGQVIWTTLGPTANRTFITGPNGAGSTDIGTLGGESTWATDIDDAGRVVGYSLTLEGGPHAFITGPDGLGMVDIGTLGWASFANGLNGAGQVVGHYWLNDGTQLAFITGADGSGPADLTSLLAMPLADGAYLTIASSINAAGQIIAEDNFGRDYLLTPAPAAVPVPASIWLLYSGLMSMAPFVKKRRKPHFDTKSRACRP